MGADGSIDFLDPRDGVRFIDDAATELLPAEMEQHGIGAVGFADLEAAFANIICE